MLVPLLFDSRWALPVESKVILMRSFAPPRPRGGRERPLRRTWKAQKQGKNRLKGSKCSLLIGSRSVNHSQWRQQQRHTGLLRRSGRRGGTTTREKKIAKSIKCADKRGPFNWQQLFVASFGIRCGFVSQEWRFFVCFIYLVGCNSRDGWLS